MILRFKQEICNTHFASRFERIDKDGNVEMIRLIEGSSEVVESKQPKEARKKTFRTGFANTKEGDEVFYQVEITDQAIINFLKKTDYWDRLVFEYDPLAVSKKESEAAQKEIAVLAKISAIKDNTELLQLGYALFGSEALDYGKKNDYEGLRVRVFRKAMADSEAVSDLLENTDKTDFLLVALAFAKGIIAEGDAGNSVIWGDQNGAKIVSVTLGERPIDALLSFFETSEGQEIRQMIGLKIEAKAKATKPAVAKTTAAKTTD